MDNAIFSQNINHPGNLPEYKVIPVRSWRNGLAVRMPNHLGDAVMAIPALMQLKKIIPEYCGLFVITPKGNAELYDALPFVDKVIKLQTAHAMWSKGERKEIKQLRAGALVVFNHSPRDVISARLTGIPEIYGAARRMRGILMTRALKFPQRTPGNPAHSHQTMRYLAISSSLGAPAWKGELPVFTPKVAPEELSPDLAAICRHRKLLLLAAGAAYGAAKRWPENNFQAVAKYWIRHGGIVAVLGSPAERPIGENVCTGLPQEKCFNLCGKTSITALIHLFKAARYTVANDSGLMHLGAILDTCGIVPFGPTDFTDTGPITEKWKILCDKVECFPCLKHSCPKAEKKCMTQLTASRIIREVKKFI